jgi:nitrite reductase/ring-hydroxylating ferredoxin subunit
MPVFVKLATVDDVPQNEMRMVEYEGEQIAIFNCNGTFYATTNICKNAPSNAPCMALVLMSRPAL